MARNANREDELWWRASVGNHDINLIMNNDPDLKHFSLETVGAGSLFGVAWELLGRFIADNDYLETISLSTGHHLTDTEMILFFNGMKNGSAAKEFTLSGNSFGLSGIRSMVPSLCSWNLTNLTITGSSCINAECFAVLVDALHGGPIETLSFNACNLQNISALEIEIDDTFPHLLAMDCTTEDISRCKLPYLHTLDLDRNNIQNISSLEYYTHLKELHLDGNDIGRDGCMVISKLLQKEDSSLRVLSLNSTSMGDDEAEILASSLQHNTKLTDLSLLDNQFRVKGCMAFLKLLNDISSIDRTYNSNHSLTSLDLPRSIDSFSCGLKKHIDFVRRINEEQEGNAEAAGRAKVIETILNSRKRMYLSRLQGIANSYGRVSTEVDPVLLPNVLALVGGKHGQSEMYLMLVAIIPDLASIMNKKDVLKQEVTENVWTAAIEFGAGDKSRRKTIKKNLASIMKKKDVLKQEVAENVPTAANEFGAGDKSRRKTVKKKRTNSFFSALLDLASCTKKLYIGK